MSYLHLFSVNGKALSVDCIDSKLQHIAVEGNRIVTADNRGNVDIRNLFRFVKAWKSGSRKKVVYKVQALYYRGM